jgi:hypothetical protein
MPRAASNAVVSGVLQLLQLCAFVTPYTALRLLRLHLLSDPQQLEQEQEALLDTVCSLRQMPCTCCARPLM